MEDRFSRFVDLWRGRRVAQAWLDALAAQPEPCEPSPERRAVVIETLMEISALIGQLPGKVGHASIRYAVLRTGEERLPLNVTPNGQDGCVSVPRCASGWNRPRSHEGLVPNYRVARTPGTTICVRRRADTLR